MEVELSAAKSAGLGWGQRYMWLRYHHLPSHARHEAHIVLRLKIPGTITLPRIRTALNYLARRHESLRTTYHVDGESGPLQRVNAPAAVALVHVTSEPDGTPSPADVIDELSTTEFDLADEWPIRACVITTAGVPAQLVLVLNHLAFDVWSITRLEREVTALGEALSSGRPVALDPIRHQPSDLARHETSADAAAVKARAIAYWRGEVSKLPANVFGGPPGDGVEPTAHSATLTSPSILAASRRIATSHQVWPYLVHVTAYNLVMAGYTRSGAVTHMSFTGNRDSGPYADTMTCMFSPLPMRVDCHDDPSFRQLLRRVAATFEQGSDHSYLPYDEYVELVSRESFRRGEDLRIGAELNFINQAQLRCRARNTRFAWNPRPTAWARSGTGVYFRIYEWQDAVVLTLNAVATAIRADSMEPFLRGYEAVLRAHDEPSVDLRVSEVAAMIAFPTPTPTPTPMPTPTPASAPAGLVIGSGGVVHPDRVAAVLESHPSVRAAHGSVAEADLVAHVVADRPVTPAQLRTHFLGQMYDHGPVRCPDRFRIYDRAAGPGGWDALTPVVEGDGRDRERAPATGAAEQALAAAVQLANGLGEISMSDSYTVAGGRVLRIPQVLARLRDAGWVGVTVYQLASARPLGALADRLTPAAR